MNWEETRTGVAGMRIAISQGLKGTEAEKFANAMTVEYYTESLGGDFISAMEDFDQNDVEDDFIIGKVVKDQGCTVIMSDEIVPKGLYGENVEIRLKKIEPMRTEYVGEVLDRGWPVVDVGLKTSYGANDYIILTRSDRKSIGKKVKITIEEVK